MHINEDIFFNDRSHQGHFLDWAFERISKEVNEIEAMEEEFGTAEWFNPQKRNGRPSISDEEKREIVDDVDRFRDQGYAYKLACELADVPQGTYSKWRHHLNMEPYKGVQG